MSFAQVLTVTELDNIVNKKHEIDIFRVKNFRLKYSAPRKQGGIISHFVNKEVNELLFIYNDDDGNVQQLNYYLPSKEQYIRLFNSLVISSIKCVKVGKTFENGEIYYQIIVHHKER